MRTYTIEEASVRSGVSETDILDALRAGELSAYAELEPAFQVPYTTKSVRHRSLLGVSADVFNFISPELLHRWQLLEEITSSDKDGDVEELRDLLQDALLAWYGAALDDPSDREAAGVIQGLAVVAQLLGLRENGSLFEGKRFPMRMAA